MLLEFRVANYRSFKDVSTLSMVAANRSAKDKSIDINNVVQVDEQLALLRSAAIYGANASGKSNLIHALRFMKHLVINSARSLQADDKIDVEPFLLSEKSPEEPSSFEIVFLLEGIRYRYGFEVTVDRVISEWLYFVPSTREARLFHRDVDGINVSSNFKEGRGNIIEITRDNALFLSVVAQFNGEISHKILRWFRNISINVGANDRSYRNFTVFSLERDKYRDDIIEFVKGLDLGVSDIGLEKELIGYQQSLPGFQEEPRGASRTVIKTAHRKFDEDGSAVSLELFNLDQHESDGTRKLFAFAGPIIDTLRQGKLLVVDELDARLHPIITCAIIELFNSKDKNPLGAQLLFTTHDTNLLSNKMFRRDQIWFTEKDAKGVTQLYSLAEFKIRNDASFEKDYINGKYGAIPFIGGLESLFYNDNGGDNDINNVIDDEVADE